MSFEEDPEVLADLQLRDSSERDSTRTRGAGVYDWRKPGDVAWWKCRGGCGVLVGVCEDVCEYRQQLNGYLRKRMEADIPVDGIVPCDKCRARFKQERAYRNWERKEAMAEAVKKLKDAKDPRKDSETLAVLEKLHHPDIPGLLDALDAKRSSSTNVRRKASGL